MTNKEKIREAVTWPTIRELAEEYQLPERYVRLLWENRAVEAVRLNTIRINRKSFEEYLLSRSSQPDA